MKLKLKTFIMIHEYLFREFLKLYVFAKFKHMVLKFKIKRLLT